jgi:hypothetical protein
VDTVNKKLKIFDFLALLFKNLQIGIHFFKTIFEINFLERIWFGYSNGTFVFKIGAKPAIL